jgi:hypothetical protein
MNKVRKNVSCVLKDHPDVLKQSEDFDIGEDVINYITNSIKNEKIKVPKRFLGHVFWKDYLTKNDYYGYFENSGFISLCECISDRMAIFTQGDLRRVDLSPYEFICFKEIFEKKVKKIENIRSQTSLSTSIFAELSIYDCIRAMYKYGLTTKECFSDESLEYDKKIKLEDIKTISNLDKVNVELLEGKERNHSIDNKIARRSFSIRGAYNVKNDIETIKKEIYKHGPVVAGFVVYDNFFNDFNADNNTIYKGPKEDSKPLGGHFVRIIGWGINDTDSTGYWFCCNNWGQKWGNYGGNFKIAMNIKECMLENNIISPVIDLGDIKTFYDYTKIEKINKEKTTVKPYNKRNFYAFDTIELIRSKKLKGSLSYILRSYDFYPSYDIFFAGDVKSFNIRLAKKNYISFYKYKLDVEQTIISILLGFIISLFIFYIYFGKAIMIKL